MNDHRYASPWTWRERLEFAGTIAAIIGLVIMLAFLSSACYVPPTPKPPPAKTHTVQAQVTPDGALQAATSITMDVDPPFGAQPACIVEGVALTCRLAANVTPPYGAHLQIIAPAYLDYEQDFVLQDVPLQPLQPIVLTPRSTHYDPSGVPLDQLARIRGAMWTETLDTPLGPRPGQPSNIAATDFLWNYSDADKLRIVTNLRALGYTHAVVGPLVDSDGYHGAWQPNDWRGANFDRFLDMLEYLWDHGLAPVVFITPDNWSLEQAQAELTPLLSQPRAQRLIRIAVRAWEPCKYECSSYTWAAYGLWLRQTLPNALALLHTVCDVDAPVGTDSRGDDNGHPNAEGWARVAPNYFGWLTQSCTFENPDGHDDPPFSNFENWTRLFNPTVRGSYQDRFQHGYAGWPRGSAAGPTTPLKVYAGEDYSYKVFWEHGTREEARRWGDAAMAQGADGYLDGGSAPVGAGPVPWQQGGE